MPRTRQLSNLLARAKALLALKHLNSNNNSGRQCSGLAFERGRQQVRVHAYAYGAALIPTSGFFVMRSRRPASPFWGRDVRCLYQQLGLADDDRPTGRVRAIGPRSICISVPYLAPNKAAPSFVAQWRAAAAAKRTFLARSPL
jgi:hypothetical protein